MKLRRLLVLAALAAPALAALPAHAQHKVIRIIVPYAPGGNIDTMARLYSKKLAEILNETWVVENRSGANGVIGSGAVAHAAPDGATLLFNGEVHSMVPLFVKNVPYDPIKDFQPIARLASSPLVFVVNPSVKADNLADLVADIKADPSKYTFAISGAGTSPHVGAERFKYRTTTTPMIVNYRGTGPAILDLAGGHVNMMMVAPPAVMQMVRTGKLKALAVTSSKRFSGAPGVPSAPEAGLPDFEVSTSFGYWAPKGLPKEMLERYSQAMKTASEDPAIVAAARELGVETMWESPDAFVKSIRTDFDANQKILVQAGVKPE